MHDCKTVSTLLPMNYKLSSSMSPSNEAENMKLSRYISNGKLNVCYNLCKTKHCISSGSNKSVHGKPRKKALEYS